MIWLVGTGKMAEAYVEVLRSLDVDVTVIGRSVENTERFGEKYPVKCISGGVEKALITEECTPHQAIIAVDVLSLPHVCEAMILAGVKQILLEKPGALDTSTIIRLHEMADRAGCKVFIGYNRRFYSSVERLAQLAKAEGGIHTCHLELNEWGHVIGPLEIEDEVKSKWFVANTAHVVDLAFSLIGFPVELHCHTQGDLSWHPTSAMAGSGVTESGTVFSYHGNWDSAGRWGAEFTTQFNRYKLSPLETLQVQAKGQLDWKNVTLDNSVDCEFKPGLKRQVEHFIHAIDGVLCPIHQQVELMPIFNRMAGYR